MINPATGKETPHIDLIIKRGDDYPGKVISFLSPPGAGAAFWANYVVKAQLRVAPDGDLVLEFSLSPVLTEVDGVGILDVHLSATKTQTATFPVPPVAIVGDVEVESDLCPKTTMVTLRANNFRDVTHA